MAVSLFLILNAVGQIPLFISILAPYEHKKQQLIIIRELFIALGLLILFNFFGKEVLHLLGISNSIIGMAGGILLFLIAITMIFPKEEKPSGLPIHEPLVIPLAIPVITGPGAIATVMLFAMKTGRPTYVLGAILIAWVPSLLILLASSYLKKILGVKGLIAVQRLGGMIVCLIGIQMFSTGIINLVKENFFREEPPKAYFEDRPF